MYPYGIYRGTMWLKLHFNVRDWQLVVLPREERQWFTPPGFAFVDREPDHYRNGCYRLTREQYARYLWSGAKKCGACAIEHVKNEIVLSTTRQILLETQ